MKTTRTYGYDRRAKVPAIAGTTARLCTSCDSWFAARGKERRCDNCVPATERRRRHALAHYREVVTSESQGPSERRTGRVSSGRVTSPTGRRFSTKRQVGGSCSDGGQLCRYLALELAEKLDYPKGRPQKMSLAVKRGYVARAVWDGLQGRCDLDRY